MIFSSLNKSQKVDMAYADEDGFWVELNPGWIWQNEVHFIHEDSANAAIDEFEHNVTRCTCEQCLIGLNVIKRRIDELELCTHRRDLILQYDYWLSF